jgi:CubicO group peptidase (beta-lactamase class C family)
MKNLKSCLFLVLIFVGQTLYAQIKTLNGQNISPAQIDKFIKVQMDSLNIPAISIAIIENGKVVYYHASGIKNINKESIDSNTVFEAASMTKPVFAYAVHKFVNEHILDLDTPLYKYYTYDDIDYDERYKLITARMVLSHSAGFPNWRSGNELTINADPGTKYSYSGEGYEYLGLVVKHLTGRKLQDIIQEDVFAPLNINNSYLIKNEYVKNHLADGLKDNKDWGKNNSWLMPHVALSLCTDAKEYAKFVIELIKESNSPNSVFQPMSVPQRQIEPGKSICLGIFMEQTPYSVKYYHSGNNNNRYNSNFEFYKDSKIGYVFFINCHQEPEFTKRLNAFLANGN